MVGVTVGVDVLVGVGVGVGYPHPLVVKDTAHVNPIPHPLYVQLIKSGESIVKKLLLINDTPARFHPETSHAKPDQRIVPLLGDTHCALPLCNVVDYV